MTQETDFIAALRGLPLHPGARGLRDDAAVLVFGGETLVLTHDAMAEGVHFRADADMADVAWKLVAVNLSDLAAKGAEPVGVLLGHTLGRGDARFVEGLHEALSEFGATLLGGDTIALGKTAKGARTFGLTAIGKAAHTPVPSRTAATAGETVWLCGRVGAAMLGFEEPTGTYGKAFARPRPLIREGIALAPLAGAMMDVSDGLLLDATRMAEASGVTLSLDSGRIEVADRSRLVECLTWGDDYALLFTVPAGATPPIDAAAIGRVLPRGEHPLLLDGEPPAPGQSLGYRHEG